METFFENYQNTFSALGAIGTLLAVIVSLWLAFRQNKPKIKVFIQKAVHVPALRDPRLNSHQQKAMLIKDSEDDFENNYYQESKKIGKEYLVATITNTGQVPVKLFSYSFSFSSWQFTWNKPFFIHKYRQLHDLEGVQKFPCVIDVAETTQIILEDLGSFRKFLSELKSRCLWSFNTSNGWINFKPKISKPLSKEIKKHFGDKK